MAASRIQRWALTLGAYELTLTAYEYTIDYRPGKDIGHADALSRLPLPQTPTSVPVPGNLLLLFEHLDTMGGGQGSGSGEGLIRMQLCSQATPPRPSQ